MSDQEREPITLAEAFIKAGEQLAESKQRRAEQREREAKEFLNMTDQELPEAPMPPNLHEWYWDGDKHEWRPLNYILRSTTAELIQAARKGEGG